VNEETQDVQEQIANWLFISKSDETANAVSVLAEYGYMHFQAFVRAGFSEQQALILTHMQISELKGKDADE